VERLAELTHRPAKWSLCNVTVGGQLRNDDQVFVLFCLLRCVRLVAETQNVVPVVN